MLQQGYRYAMALSGHHHDAEDLVQEAWIKYTRSWRPVKSRGYFFRIIRNHFLDTRRKQQRIFVYAEKDLDALLEPLGDVAIENVDFSDQSLKKALVLLAVSERELLFLHYVAEYTTRELASHLNKPRNTVLSQLHRARQKLKKYMSEDSICPK